MNLPRNAVDKCVGVCVRPGASGAATGGSVTVLGHVHNHRLLPAEQEVAAGGADDDRQAQPHVVRHEDQHQQERDGHLDDVQQRLVQVHRREHGGPRRERP